MSDHVFARIRERSPESSHARWLAIVRVVSRYGVLGAIRDKVGSGDFRVVAASGQLVIDRRGRPVTFNVGGSQPGCPTISLDTLEALYEHAGLWERPVQALDWKAVARWFAAFEAHNPELKGATRSQVEAGMLLVRGWTNQTLVALIREGKVNVQEGYYYLSRTAWQDAVLKGLFVLVGAVLAATHLFLP